MSMTKNSAGGRMVTCASIQAQRPLPQVGRRITNRLIKVRTTILDISYQCRDVCILLDGVPTPKVVGLVEVQARARYNTTPLEVGETIDLYA